MRRLALALTLCCAAPAAAQSAFDPVFAVRVSPECGGTQALARLRDALALRVPEASFVRRPGDADATVNWRWTAAGCEVEVATPSDEAVYALAADASDGDVHATAARVAWLAAVAMGLDPLTGEPPAAPEPAPPAPPPATVEAGEGALEPRGPPGDPPPTVAFGASLVPGLDAPNRADRDAVRNASLNLLLGRSAGITGLEIGLGANHTGTLRGGQIALGYNRATEGTGAQISAGVNVVDRDFSGYQQGVVNVAIPRADTRYAGLQYGVVNVAGDLVGAQIGVANRARDVRGLQYGLVNVARRSAASVGVVNVVRTEPVRAVVLGSDTGLLEAGLRHGSPAVQNVLMLGVAPIAAADRLLVPTWGIGGHIAARRLAFVELDLLVSPLFRPPSAADAGYAGTLLRPRVSIGLQLAPRVAVLAGLSQSALFVGSEDRLGLAWSRATPIAAGGNFVYLWPTFHAGLQF